MLQSAPDRRSRQVALAALIRRARVIPVITIERAEDAVPLARALVAGGIDHVEITLRTAAAPAAAAAIRAQVPEAVLGIGTILTPHDLDQAQELGARFALSPGVTPELLDAAANRGLPFVPGISTPSELMQAVARGFDVVKFFPATASGGMAAVKALAGPFPQVRFCPTGGIGEDNLVEWLKLPNVLAVGGSWLTPAAEIKDGRWQAITERARRALAKVNEA